MHQMKAQSVRLITGLKQVANRAEKRRCSYGVDQPRLSSKADTPVAITQRAIDGTSSVNGAANEYPRLSHCQQSALVPPIIIVTGPENSGLLMTLLYSANKQPP